MSVFALWRLTFVPRTRSLLSSANSATRRQESVDGEEECVVRSKPKPSHIEPSATKPSQDVASEERSDSEKEEQ